jgi:SsrA-binding protein
MDKFLAENKKAHFDYEILEKFEAGIVLFGHEVKAVKNGNISLKGAYVTIHNGAPYLTNAYVGLYKPAGKVEGYDPERSRKLLLKNKEIRYLTGKKEEKGLTIVPLLVYIKGSKVKIQIGIGKGKRQFEKKDKIKKRDLEREVKRTLKF